MSPSNGVSRLTTPRFALSRAEWVTTAVAAGVSTGAYLTSGFPYLARGVVGDLLGFTVLAAVGAVRRQRLVHEAALCLLLIGLVLAAGPRWPLALPESAWWVLFLVALTAYVGVRRRVCD